jgi:hypothetical protein
MVRNEAASCCPSAWLSIGTASNATYMCVAWFHTFFSAAEVDEVTELWLLFLGVSDLSNNPLTELEAESFVDMAQLQTVLYVCSLYATAWWLIYRVI